MVRETVTIFLRCMLSTPPGWFFENIRQFTEDGWEKWDQLRSDWPRLYAGLKCGRRDHTDEATNIDEKESEERTRTEAV
jgi:hypothetical protein